jgi:hypothetical protein
MLIPSSTASPSASGPRASTGWSRSRRTAPSLVEVADVGEDGPARPRRAAGRPGPGLPAVAAGRGPYEPTPIGVFRAVERPEYVRSLFRNVSSPCRRS